MSNPFDGDDDESTRKLEEHLRQGIEDAKVKDLSVHDDLDIPLAVDKDENREEKKANRFREAQERADRAERRTRELEAENAAYRVQQRRPEPTEDPFKAQLDKVYKDRQSLSDEYEAGRTAGSLTAERAEQMRDRARELEEHTTELIAQRAAAKRDASRDPREDTIREIGNRHPDVTANASALQWADGRARQRLAKGETYSQRLVDEVMDEARQEFRMDREERDPDRYRSPPRGSSPRGDRMPEKITMTANMRKEADMVFSHIENPAERYKLWATKAGPKFLKREREAGR